MQLLVLILNEPGRLNEVVTAMVEAGIRGATIVESFGMGKILARDIPIFAGFRHLLSAAQPYNHTIFSVVEDETSVESLKNLLTDMLKPKQGVSPALMITVPVTGFHRIPEPPSPKS